MGKREAVKVDKKAVLKLLFPGLFLLAVLLYEETLVKALCGVFSWRGMVLTALLSLPLAALAGTACAAVPVKWGRGLLIAFTAVCSVWLGGQAVYFDLFQTFFSLFSVGMAGMVMGDFGAQTAALIGRNVLPIALFVLPIVLSVVLRKKILSEECSADKRTALLGLAAAAALHLLALAVVLGSTGGAMSVRYLYTHPASPQLQIAQFGVVTATRLEAKWAIFGEPEEETEDVSEPPAQEDAAEEQVPTEENAPPAEETEEIPEEPIVYGDNVLPIDFEALIAGESNETVRDMHSYFSSVQPTKQNEWTGYFEGKNLIWIVAEAYSSLAIDEELTPTLYKLSQEGFHFENFYTPSWGVSTSDGEYVTTTGLIPKSGVWSYLRSAENAMPFGFGHLFAPLGYRTLAYHNHSYTYYGRDQSYPNMGYEYYGVGNGLQISKAWPESDVELMEVSVPQYINDERFMVYYLTVSGHLEYNFGGNAMANKHKSEVAHLPYSDAAKAYMACQMELDQAMASLIAQLEAAGKLEDTVIVLSGDHYPYGLNHEQISELLGHAVEPDFELYKSTLLLWNAGMDERVTVEKYCSSLDVMPTLANLFALPYDSRLVMGRDILSDSPGLVIFSNYSFLSDVGAYRAGRDAFTPWDGSEPDYDYVRGVLSDVKNRFAYSRKILEQDYYAKVLPQQ